ncbi:MAG: alpha-glucosidase/alpha-galactosidase, partial [Clostridia bacterium]|nr:alpha-glucosidase/alpha-galactosidase [Clostridia bacterium]
MIYENHSVKELKIAYIGGGSRGWAWGLMSDLASAEDISGTVALYDIDLKAARDNAVIGAKFNAAEGAKSKWDYVVAETLEEALTGADFVVISILPGTFDEMESDVHTPEKYGIYQSVGDTSGPGGIIRALRTIPMMQVIAKGIEKCCPEAWVINYTNPMTVSVKALYETFPGIKAFGCCHEVFGTQKLLATALEDIAGIEGVQRHE